MLARTARIRTSYYWKRFLHIDFTAQPQLDRHELDAAAAEYGDRLQSCRDLAQARHLHEEILHSSPGLLESNAFIGNLIVTAYRKCGSMDEARAAFESLKLKNVITWNAMLATLADHGEFQATLHAFNRMLHEGTIPSVVTFISVLGACAGLSDWSSGNRALTFATELGFHTDLVVGNVLVNLYGKCGDLQQAKVVFSGICNKSTVSWTSMAAANADNGHFGEALELFRGMLLDGLRHNSPSFLTALHACQSLREADEIHSQACESGLVSSDVSIGNALVKAYGKLGEVEIAMEVFEGMAVRDLGSWNAMVASFAQNGCSEEAMDFFCRMLLEGVSPHGNSFAGGVLSCVCGKELSRLVRGCIEEGGFDADIAVSNALITFHSRSGALEEAGEVFQRLDRPNLVSWNSIISACVQNDCADSAVLLFRKMQLQGFAADKFTLTSLLDACRCLSLGRQILEWINTELKLQQQHDSLLGIATLNMFAMCGSTARAREIFDEMITRTKNNSAVNDVVLWNELIRSYVDNGCSHEAMQSFRMMLLEAAASPNSVTLSRVLAACCEEEPCREMVESLAMESGWGSDAQVSNALVGSLARTGSVEQALERVILHKNTNVVAWTSVITGFVDRGLHEEALKLFPVMAMEGVRPDGVAFAAMLAACAGAVNSDRGKKIHSQVLESGLESDPAVASSLVAMYARCGNLVTAYKMLTSIEQEHHKVLVVSWNNFIGACIQHGQHATAVTMFRRMLLQGIAPNKVSFITVLAACRMESTARLGQVVHSACKECGLFADVFVKNSLADMYGKLGNLALARQILGEVPVKSLVSWNSLVSAFAQHGGGEEAVVLLWEMQQNGIKPNATTFARVISCAVEASKVYHWIESMQGDHGLVPGMEHLRGVAEILGREGKLGEAERIISKMAVEFRGGMWLSLLGWCRRHGDVNRERLAAERILELEPLNAVARQVVTLLTRKT